MQSSNHITVEDIPFHNDINYGVEEPTPLLEDDIQLTVDELNEIYLGSLKDPHSTFLVCFLHLMKRGNI